MCCAAQSSLEWKHYDGTRGKSNCFQILTRILNQELSLSRTHWKQIEFRVRRFWTKPNKIHRSKPSNGRNIPFVVNFVLFWNHVDTMNAFWAIDFSYPVASVHIKHHPSCNWKLNINTQEWWQRYHIYISELNLVDLRLPPSTPPQFNPQYFCIQIQWHIETIHRTSLFVWIYQWN